MAVDKRAGFARGKGMRVGVVFPQTELGGDVGAVRAYGQGVEGLGYDHLLAYDHVVGADPAVYEGWDGYYDVDTTFHEPLVMFGYLAAATTTLEFVTGVLILPQRQTVLVAKQAAEVDLLSQGRFRLGIGIGWNAVEYDALGEDFGVRGARSEEQIDLMRRLWTERSVTFEGKFDTVTGAGIAPPPVQRPIPVWIGTASAKGYERIGRLADGWFPMMGPGPKLDEARAAVREAAVAAGRDPEALGLQGQVRSSIEPDTVAAELAAWAEAGATHVAVSTMGQGLTTVDDHLAALAGVAGRFG
jgi:probable F420-dependent oxidoreductase